MLTSRAAHGVRTLLSREAERVFAARATLVNVGRPVAALRTGEGASVAEFPGEPQPEGVLAHSRIDVPRHNAEDGVAHDRSLDKTDPDAPDKQIDNDECNTHPHKYAAKKINAVSPLHKTVEPALEAAAISVHCVRSFRFYGIPAVLHLCKAPTLVAPMRSPHRPRPSTHRRIPRP